MEVGREGAGGLGRDFPEDGGTRELDRERMRAGGSSWASEGGGVCRDHSAMGLWVGVSWLSIFPLGSS